MKKTHEQPLLELCFLFQFHEYSKSMKTISEMDFAKILLRSTKLSKIEHSDYLDRMKGRLELTDHPKVS